jgi:hypothetical protein
MTGQAPSEVLEITVYVVALSGWCTLRNETPASDPSSATNGPSQKPRP